MCVLLYYLIIQKLAFYIKQKKNLLVVVCGKEDVPCEKREHQTEVPRDKVGVEASFDLGLCLTP